VHEEVSRRDARRPTFSGKRSPAQIFGTTLFSACRLPVARQPAAARAPGRFSLELKQLIDIRSVRCGAIARKHVRDEAVRRSAAWEQLDHLVLIDASTRARSDRAGDEDADRLHRKAAFAEEVARAEHATTASRKVFGKHRTASRAVLLYMTQSHGSALREDAFVPAISRFCLKGLASRETPSHWKGRGALEDGSMPVAPGPH